MPFRFREAVRGMRPYVPGRPVEEVQKELGLADVVKLASNENPLGPSPKAAEAARQAAASVHRYPDASGAELRAALAKRLAIPESQVFLGNGSDELIQLLGLVLLDSESEMVASNPSFVRYEAAGKLGGARVVSVPVDAHHRHDLPAMAKAVTHRTQIVWLDNPNNPTGTIVRRAELEAFLADMPDHVLTVLDEAYFEFVDDPGYPDSAELVRSGRPVAGLRTFSKTYGLAGLRIGYGFGPPELGDAIGRVRPPFNVGSVSQRAALAALGDSEFLERSRIANRDGLARLAAMFERIGAKVSESHANFVWADLGAPSAPLCEALLREGVIVRGGAALGDPNCIRVSVGAEAELDKLEAALAKVGAGAASQ